MWVWPQTSKALQLRAIIKRRIQLQAVTYNIPNSWGWVFQYRHTSFYCMWLNYRHTSFYCMWLYCASQVCFYQNKGKNPPSAKRVWIALLRWPGTKTAVSPRYACIEDEIYWQHPVTTTIHIHNHSIFLASFVLKGYCICTPTLAFGVSKVLLYLYSIYIQTFHFGGDYLCLF